MPINSVSSGYGKGDFVPTALDQIEDLMGLHRVLQITRDVNRLMARRHTAPLRLDSDASGGRAYHLWHPRRWRPGAEGPRRRDRDQLAGPLLGVGPWPTARDGRLFSYGIIGYATPDTMQLHLARGEALQST